MPPRRTTPQPTKKPTKRVPADPPQPTGPTREQVSTLYGCVGREFEPDDDPIEPFSDSEYNGL